MMNHKVGTKRVKEGAALERAEGSYNGYIKINGIDAYDFGQQAQGRKLDQTRGFGSYFHEMSVLLHVSNKMSFSRSGSSIFDGRWMLPWPLEGSQRSKPE
jgi:hypothetical protein